jgi:hypothetical protein
MVVVVVAVVVVMSIGRERAFIVRFSLQRPLVLKSRRLIGGTSEVLKRV